MKKTLCHALRPSPFIFFFVCVIVVVVFSLRISRNSRTYTASSLRFLFFLLLFIEVLCALYVCCRAFFPPLFLVFFSVFDSDRNAFMGVCMYVCFTTFAIWGNVVKLRSWCPLRSLHNSCDPLVYVITSARKTSATQDRQKDKQTTETTETTERVVLGCWFSCPGCERSVELLHRNKQNRS